jgi:hypothetical protein
MTGLIDDEEVFDRMALPLSTVAFLLVLWIGWAVDRSFSCEQHSERIGRAGWQELLVD